MSFEEKLDFGEMYKELVRILKEYNHFLNGIQGSYLVPKPIRNLLIFLKKKGIEKPKRRIKPKYLRRMVNSELNKEFKT